MEFKTMYYVVEQIDRHFPFLLELISQPAGHPQKRQIKPADIMSVAKSSLQKVSSITNPPRIPQ